LCWGDLDASIARYDYRFRHRLAIETAAIRELIERALNADEAPEPKPGGRRRLKP
jgi:hypothetical protein